MSDLRTTITRWCDERRVEMLAAPRMWGSREAVELQLLLLQELRSLAINPELQLGDPRRVLDLYVELVARRFPSEPRRPLFEIADLSDTDFKSELSRVHAELSARMRPENPFDHCDLAVDLIFSEVPTMSAITGFYESFRRATRAVARGGIGRRSKVVEHATDYELSETVVSPPNGVDGHVLLKLSLHKGQSDYVAEDAARGALTSMLTLAEWADSGQPPSALAFDDAERRTFASLQALRLLPRKPIKKAAIGGRFLGRSAPVMLRTDQYPRLLEVVHQDMVPKVYDQTDQVRAIDLDRGFIRHGRGRIVCWLSADLMARVSELGVPARVMGELYEPVGATAFVLVSDIEAAESSDGPMSAA